MGERASHFFSARRAALGGRRISHIALGSDGSPLWVESVPEQRGRFRLCVLSHDGVKEISPTELNVRSVFREYGGGEFCERGGVLVFVSADGKLWLLREGRRSEVVTDTKRYRYGDLVLHPSKSLLVAVEEELGAEGAALAERLVMLDIDGGSRSVLWEGSDFIGAPRFDSMGEGLVWKTWMHPYMPWDENSLWRAEIAAGGVAGARQIFSRSGCSVCQAEWASDGELRAVVEIDGEWLLAKDVGGDWEGCRGRGLEWGRPEWVPGLRTFGMNDLGKVVASVCERGRWRIVEYDESTGNVRDLDLPFSEVQNIAVRDRWLLVVGGDAEHVPSVHLFERVRDCYVRRWSRDEIEASAELSKPRLVEYTARGGMRLNAWLYLPQERSAVDPPPVIVRVHGGPTGCAQSALDFRYQYWTSRGFAIVDINYRGSSGFGRRVRDALYGWAGEYEVLDCEDLLRELGGAGLVNTNACFIWGSSAGGFVALAAAFRSSFFRGAVVYYGISDVEQLVRATPRFERGYLERLFGERGRWRGVSPYWSEGQACCALLMIHGSEDKIVPIEQSRRMAERIVARGGEVELIELEGEGHGVRAASNIERCLCAELTFLTKRI